MAIISSYPKDSNISLMDKLIGTDADSSLATKNYLIGDFITFLGTQNIGTQGPIGPQGVQGPTGANGAVGPAGLTWEGIWVSGTSYVANDSVSYNGASWFCISAVTGTTPPNADPTNWALLASQGAQGPQGVQGPTGPQGGVGIVPNAQEGVKGIASLASTVEVGQGINGTNIVTPVKLKAVLDLKQNTLVSGTNIKTINGSDILGSGDLVVSGGSPKTSGTITLNGTFQVLPYDINSCSFGGGKAFLPTTTENGKEIIVLSTANNIEIRANSAGTNFMFVKFQTFVSSVTLATNEVYRFTYVGFGGYWKAEILEGYTTENIANKSTDVALGTSDILYPSQNAVKTYVDQKTQKIYAVTLSQTGGNAPIVNLEYKNDITDPIVWSRFADGQYIGTITTSEFTIKTFFATLNAKQGCTCTANTTSANTFILRTYNTATFSFEDGLLNNSQFKIEIYN